MSERSRRLWRIAAVLVIAGVPVIASLVNLATPFVHYARFGFVASSNGVVAAVLPDSAASDAGVKPGDRLDVATLTPQQRVYLHWPLTLAGTRTTFRFVKGPARAVTLVARSGHSSFGVKLSYFAFFYLLVLSIIATVLVAAALVLAHPSRMTWAFLFFAAGSQTGSPILTALISPPWIVAYSAYCGIVWFAASIALVVFALRFPADQVRGVGAVADRWLPWLAVIVAPFIVYANVGLVYRGTNTTGFESLLTIASTALYALAVVTFGIRYTTEGQDERPRMAWVIASFLVGYAGSVATRIFDSVGLAVPSELWNFLLTLNVAGPIAVAYAIVKQRVISVRFFVNKAVIFAVLASLAIGALVLLDWSVAGRLERLFPIGGVARIGVNVAAALVLGLLMSWLYAPLRDFVDRHLFPQQYRTRRTMIELARGLVHTESAQMIDEALVRSVSGSLEIGSVAVFVRGDDGTFRREAAEGWGDDDVLERLDMERLADSFEQAKGALRFADLQLIGGRVPTGDAAPAVGFPIFVRGTLSRFVLFSGHPHGLELDPSERRLIGEVTRAASHGFARLSQM